MNYYGARDIADSFRTVRKNTIQVAEDIPEDKYSFRAAPDTMSVGEMLSHLACSPYWAQQCFFNEMKTDVTMGDFGRWMGELSGKAKTLTTKAQIVEALKADGEAFAKQVEGMSEAQLAQPITAPNATKSTFEMLLGIKEHEMHHRAQLFMLQRMIGIVPHLTRARMERMAQQAAPAR